MFIIGLGTAAPTQRYIQLEGWESVQSSSEFSKLGLRSRAILKKVLTGNNGIVTRHLALDKLEHAFAPTPDILHERFLHNAPRLATQAAKCALAESKTGPREIDAILISTCTGYLCPGLTSYVGEKLELRPDVFTLDLVGQGCGAALPNLRAANALIHSGQSARVLSICVEVCSAAFYLDEDIGVLISACLFGDGAAAAVLSNSPGNNRKVKWHSAGSLLKPENRETLRFEQKCGMLRNILKPEVPELAATHAETVLTDTLMRANVPRSQIGGWIFHPGGRDVIVALRNKLKLSNDDLRWSEGVLREYGNMSSPSVIFVLQSALNGVAPGGWWWMSSFGAGFSCHGALLEVE